MGFRFSRRIRVLPGVRINLSKSGVSTSVGTRGAWLTFGKRGTRATVGLPGTGISYTMTSKPHEPTPVQTSAPEGEPMRRGRAHQLAWLLLALIVAALVARWALSQP
ncbi:MAG: DUF4236 domain-containing protein [Proteobacteria bacterium]|nr:DUF4236 domain-containing protein [Pseudomonadota bacterium]